MWYPPELRNPGPAPVVTRTLDVAAPNPAPTHQPGPDVIAVPVPTDRPVPPAAASRTALQPPRTAVADVVLLVRDARGNRHSRRRALVLMGVALAIGLATAAASLTWDRGSSDPEGPEVLGEQVEPDSIP